MNIHTHLSGPVSLNEFYDPIENIHLYVFGDWHFLESKCPSHAVSISQFIKETVDANQYKEIHLFLETEHLSKTLRKNPYLNGRKVDTYIGDIVRSFSSCFSKRSCGNFNINAIDFRITQQTPAVLLLNSLVDIRKNKSVKQILAYYLKEVINSIKLENKRNILDIMVSLYDINEEMKKTIKVTPSSIHKLIQKFLFLHIKKENLPSCYYDLLDILSYSANLLNNGYIEEMKYKMEAFELLSNHVLNYYVLCLIFSSSHYNNSMIYVGEEHARIICQFLIYTNNFNHIFSVKSCANATCYQCLKIENLHQPLFNKSN